MYVVDFSLSLCFYQIIGVDPIGSILAEPEELNKEGDGAPYQVN